MLNNTVSMNGLVNRISTSHSVTKISNKSTTINSSEVSNLSKVSLKRNWNTMRTNAPVNGTREFSKLRALIFRSKEILDVFKVVRSEVLRRGRDIQLIVAQMKLNKNTHIDIPERVDTSVVGAAIQRAGQLSSNPDLVYSFFKETLTWASVGLIKLDRPVILFGIMIDFLANNDRGALALRVYSEMLAYGVSPNSIVVTSTVKACRLAHDYNSALRIFRHAIDVCKVAPTLPMFTEMVKAAVWTSCNASLDSNTTSCTCDSSTCQDGLSCNVPAVRIRTLLQKVIEAENSITNSSVSSEDEDEKKPFRIDLVFLVVCLSLLAKINDMAGVRIIECLVIDRAEELIIGATNQSSAMCSILNALAKIGKLQVAFRFFDKVVALNNFLKNDLASWTCLISNVYSAIEARVEEPTTKISKFRNNNSGNSHVDGVHAHLLDNTTEDHQETDEAIADEAEFSVTNTQFFELALVRLIHCVTVKLCLTLDKAFCQVATRALLLVNRMDRALALYHFVYSQKKLFNHWSMNKNTKTYVLDLSDFTAFMARVALIYALVFEAELVVSSMTEEGINVLFSPASQGVSMTVSFLETMKASIMNTSTISNRSQKHSSQRHSNEELVTTYIDDAQINDTYSVLNVFSCLNPKCIYPGVTLVTEANVDQSSSNPELSSTPPMLHLSRSGLEEFYSMKFSFILSCLNVANASDENPIQKLEEDPFKPLDNLMNSVDENCEELRWTLLGLRFAPRAVTNTCSLSEFCGRFSVNHFNNKCRTSQTAYHCNGVKESPPGFFIKVSDLENPRDATCNDEPILPPGLQIHHAVAYALVSMAIGDGRGNHGSLSSAASSYKEEEDDIECVSEDEDDEVYHPSCCSDLNNSNNSQKLKVVLDGARKKVSLSASASGAALTISTMEPSTVGNAA